MDNKTNDMILVTLLKYQLITDTPDFIIRHYCRTQIELLKFVLSVADTMSMDRDFFILNDEITKKALKIINCIKLSETTKYNIDDELDIIANYLRKCLGTDDKIKNIKKDYYQFIEEKRRKVGFLKSDVMLDSIAYDAVAVHAIMTRDYSMINDIDLFLMSVSSIANKMPVLIIKFEAADYIIDICDIRLNTCKEDDYDTITYCEYIISLMRELKNSKIM